MYFYFALFYIILEPWVVTHSQSMLELAVDGDSLTCVELPSKYITHHLNMCLGRSTSRFAVHLNATNNNACAKTRVSMRQTSDVLEEDWCQTPREYVRCLQSEPCTYSCQYGNDTVCAVLLLQIRAPTENENFCEIEIFPAP